MVNNWFVSCSQDHPPRFTNDDFWPPSFLIFATVCGDDLWKPGICSHEPGFIWLCYWRYTRFPGLLNWFSVFWDFWVIWVNYNNSLTWNLAAIWGWFPLLTMISSEGEQWGRYNLPRYMVNNWFVSCSQDHPPRFMNDDFWPPSFLIFATVCGDDLWKPGICSHEPGFIWLCYWRYTRFPGLLNWFSVFWDFWVIWVNYNNSLTWILRPFGDDFPY